MLTSILQDIRLGIFRIETLTSQMHRIFTELNSVSRPSWAYELFDPKKNPTYRMLSDLREKERNRIYLLLSSEKGRKLLAKSRLVSKDYRKTLNLGTVVIPGIKVWRFLRSLERHGFIKPARIRIRI